MKLISVFRAITPKIMNIVKSTERIILAVGKVTGMPASHVNADIISIEMVMLIVIRKKKSTPGKT